MTRDTSGRRSKERPVVPSTLIFCRQSTSPHQSSASTVETTSGERVRAHTGVQSAAARTTARARAAVRCTRVSGTGPLSRRPPAPSPNRCPSHPLPQIQCSCCHCWDLAGVAPVPGLEPAYPGRTWCRPSCSCHYSSLVPGWGSLLSTPPIHKWTANNVLEWVGSINMISTAECLKSMNVDGMQLLNLDKEKLMSMGIKDPFTQTMLLMAVRRLQAGEGGAAGEIRPGHPPAGHSASEHQLRQDSFSTLRTCDVCGLYLIGTDHQGYSCTECGLVVHRRCGSQPAGLPACEPGTVGRPAPSLFGAELTATFQSGRQLGPPVLIACLSALERLCERDRHINCYEIYEETTPTWDDLKPLRDALERDPEGADLGEFDLSHVSCLVKKYLAQLPNPVIPTEAYEDMLTLAKAYKDSAEGCAPDVDAFVSRLQDHHAATLRLVMRHVCRLCRLQQDRGCRFPPAQLLKTLSFVLIRPPYDQLTTWVERSSLHTRVLELLVMNYEWGGPNVTAWDPPPPALPPRPSRDATPRISRESSQPTYLRRELDPKPEWYWGNISREEASEKLNGQPDGTFLVRDSQTASGEYTLCLRKGGNNRLIRICSKYGKFGFSEPYQFDSVASLIDHYRRESLREYNAQLDVRLERPLAEPRPHASESAAELIKKLCKAHARHDKLEGELERLEKLKNSVTERITIQKKALEAYIELVHMLEKQRELHLANRSKAQLHEKEQLSKNFQLLESRLEQVRHCKEQVEEELAKQHPYARTTDHGLISVRQEERSLQQFKSEVLRELRWRGITQDRLEKLQVGKDTDVTDRGAGVTPLSEQEEYWLLEDWDRQRADAVLSDKPDGTFLIRRRRDRPEMYVLSIRALGQVQHCLIDRTERGFGFSKPYAIHASLHALVDHYAENELGEFNDKLPTRLKYPALARPPADYLCLPD
ncbi:phosphatidylinositol 3-kinase regulatory subunit alpha-like isoform X2 [Amphibalanus amphitrite]|uniref:phosphatidylinositol 3-kinase regulatory subunit alpha-like isoform X2 n=1 Tax=Amphibalanus amphitrite TaxID=1232801 RepID=UPI001C90FC8C|nr:phosphatidylinositol 3-kinase regulatory subunit alpha-like isoform X2 [Amphibalanus amphitrite]